MEDSLEGLLTLFVALTAIAVITQAGVLVGIYIMSKRLSGQVERFMKETREMMVPVRSIAENLGGFGQSCRDRIVRTRSVPACRSHGYRYR